MRHESAIVYQKSLQLMDTAREAILQFPPGFAFLADELRRNTSSVSRSFAEGYYYDSKPQQRRYFGYAVQSAREASASFDTARSFRICHEDTIERGKALALEVVKILSKWGR
jgi:four helix bundle protein